MKYSLLFALKLKLQGQLVFDVKYSTKVIEFSANAISPAWGGNKTTVRKTPMILMICKLQIDSFQFQLYFGQFVQHYIMVHA